MLLDAPFYVSFVINTSVGYGDVLPLGRCGSFRFSRRSPAHLRRAGRQDLALYVPIGTDGARLLGYEYLIDIDVRSSTALLWPWNEISKHVGEVEHFGGESGRGYQGRHVAVLYNSATGRRIGTTHSFFASIAQFPPGMLTFPLATLRRRSITYSPAAAAVRLLAGDLMLSAPACAVRNHTSGDNRLVLEPPSCKRVAGLLQLPGMSSSEALWLLKT